MANENDELDALDAARKDMAIDGKYQYPEAGDSQDYRKTTKDDVFYEDGDGANEVSWKKMIGSLFGF